MLKKFFGLLCCLSLIVVWSSRSLAQAKFDAVVAADGTGNYSEIQSAINAAPDGRTAPYRIFIKKGKYIGQINIPESKPFIELIGEDTNNTFIIYGDGTPGSSTMIINASNCMLMNLTLQNPQGAIADGPQSLACRNNGDHIVFFNCRFISGQDTLLCSKGGTASYFKSCYIDGNTDFIYGAATCVFDNCVIFLRDRVDGKRSSYVTAASTPAGQPYGLVFRNCIIPDNHGITCGTLGRPWQNYAAAHLKGRPRAENKVVFLNTTMGNSIKPEGWSVWDAGTVTGLITYAEYNSHSMDGKLLDVSQRVAWSKQLTNAEAAPYFNDKNIFGDWNPYEVWKDLPKAEVKHSLTINNLIARKIDDKASIQFNSSWPEDGIIYTLYKAEASGAPLKKIASLTTQGRNKIAYQFEDKLPEENLQVYYQLVASRGSETLKSDTLVTDLAAMDKTSPKQ